MGIDNIDDMAFKGFDFASEKGEMPLFTDDMDLMAFNAGISNANIRYGLKVPSVNYYKTKHIETRIRASDKELQTVWGLN